MPDSITDTIRTWDIWKPPNSVSMIGGPTTRETNGVRVVALEDLIAAAGEGSGHDIEVRIGALDWELAHPKG